MNRRNFNGFSSEQMHMMLYRPLEVKLTAQGYIPPKMVAELYELGSHSWSTDWYKQKSEPICMKTTMWVI